MKKPILFLLILLSSFYSSNVYAGDELRAGVISLKQLSQTTIEATVQLVVEAHADITDLNLCWGDGICSTFPILSGTVNTFQGLKYYSFTDTYTYDELGTYTTYISHCCFDDDITNVSSGGESDFRIETMIVLQEEDFNNTPLYPNSLVDVDTAQVVVFVQGAGEDAEGDEYTNELCTPQNVMDYIDLVGLFPNTIISLSGATGDLVWNSPVSDGVFIAQICTDEIRNGAIISSTQRIVCFMTGPDFVSANPKLSTAGIALFPNPVVADYLYLKKEGEVDVIGSKLLVVNALQQVVHMDEWNGSTQQKLNVKHLPKGQYYVFLLLNNGERYYEPIVIH